MNINISYNLEEYGWSTCIFQIEEKIYEISITHIFPNHHPIERCLQALISITKGKKENEFYWYGEPGGEKIYLKENPNQKENLMFSAINCEHFYEKQNLKNEILFEFEISKKVLITQFYFEFKKISILMQEKEYSKNRKGEFPFEIFKIFERELKEAFEFSW